MYYFACFAVLAAGYCLSLGYVSIVYHRCLAHGSITPKPWLKGFLVASGSWVTGVDAKAWVCMHRRHHEFSDTALDPHSPRNVGVLGVVREQLKSYETTLVGLIRKNREYTDRVQDLDFDISWLNRKRVWYLPYLFHLVIGVAIGLVFGAWLLGAAYWLGTMSHPLQGWAVNALGHARGGRNFDTDDDSRNNRLVAWLVAGEGYQNNHHQYPESARFSYRKSEVDLGYVACVALEKLGLMTVRREALIPRPPRALSTEARTAPAAPHGISADSART